MVNSMTVFKGNQREILKGLLKNLLEKTSLTYNRSNSTLQLGAEKIQLPRLTQREVLSTKTSIFR